MTKLKAFSIHLGISASIFFVILYFIVFHWYPQPFFTTDGGWQGIRIVAGVDMVLGPLLTLIVFKPGKPNLKMDMTIIVIIQTAALISGTWLVFKERPLAVVFADNKFNPVPYYQIIEEAKLSPKDFDQFGDEYPVKVIIDLPTDEKELDAARREAFTSFRPLYLQGERYRKLEKKHVAYLRQKSVDMETYLANKPEDQKKYRAFLEQQGKEAGEFLFLPLHSRFASFIVAMDPQTLEFVEALDIIPPTKFPDLIRKQPAAPGKSEKGGAPEKKPRLNPQSA